METRTETIEAVSVNWVSWGAIFAGVFVALTVATLLNLLGLGLEMLTIPTHRMPISEISILSIVWLVLTSIIAMVAGAWVAGRMSGPGFVSEGVLHGLVTWAVTTLLTFILVTTSLGALIGVMATFVGHSVILVQQSPAQVQQNNAMNNQSMGIPQAQNDQMQNNQMQNDQMQNGQTMNVAAEKAGHALGMVALIIFITHLLSAIAAAYAGMWGAQSDRRLFIREVR